MARIQPVTFKWRQVEIVDDDGVAVRRKAMVPLPRFDNLCGRQWHDDEEYTLVPLEARSRASHNHYFAALQDGFDNIPENVAGRWGTAENFRKWALVECNWFNEREIDCPDEEFARKLGAFIRDEHENEYVCILVHRPADRNDRWKVIVRHPKSQSQAMGKDAFEKSKHDVLELLEHFTSVPKGTLMKEAGRNA